jgi:hypothetical protein
VVLLRRRVFAVEIEQLNEGCVRSRRRIAPAARSNRD